MGKLCILLISVLQLMCMFVNLNRVTQIWLVIKLFFSTALVFVHVTRTPAIHMYLCICIRTFPNICISGREFSFRYALASIWVDSDLRSMFFVSFKFRAIVAQRLALYWSCGAHRDISVICPQGFAANINTIVCTFFLFWRNVPLLSFFVYADKIIFISALRAGEVDDFSFFDCSSPFFLLAEFHCNFIIPYL